MYREGIKTTGVLTNSGTGGIPNTPQTDYKGETVFGWVAYHLKVGSNLIAHMC